MDIKNLWHMYIMTNSGQVFPDGDAMDQVRAKNGVSEETFNFTEMLYLYTASKKSHIDARDGRMHLGRKYGSKKRVMRGHFEGLRIECVKLTSNMGPLLIHKICTVHRV